MYISSKIKMTKEKQNNDWKWVMERDFSTPPYSSRLWAGFFPAACFSSCWLGSLGPCWSLRGFSSTWEAEEEVLISWMKDTSSLRYLWEMQMKVQNDRWLIIFSDLVTPCGLREKGSLCLMVRKKMAESRKSMEELVFTERWWDQSWKMMMSLSGGLRRSGDLYSVHPGSSLSCRKEFKDGQVLAEGKSFARKQKVKVCTLRARYRRSQDWEAPPGIKVGVY